MVYTDGLHLMASTLEELHLFATSIGLKRDWFQNNKKHPHYDIWGVMLQRAVARGAQVVKSKEMFNYIKKSGKAFTEVAR